MTEITIPEGITTIGDIAFSACYRLSTVTLPKGVTTIGKEAFANCDELISVTIPNSVTTIGTWAFYGCKALSSVTIPESVISIGEIPFFDCPALTSIEVDSNNPQYSSLDGVLFNKDKTSLIQYPAGKQGDYSIPNGVITIGPDAFRSCGDALLSITIPNSVELIGDLAFAGCYQLTSVTIPNSVTSIGEMAFEDCREIQTVYSKAKTPPVITTNSFAESVQKNATLYVPTGSKAQYEAIDGWFAFWDIQELDELGVEDNLAEGITITTQNGAIVVNGVNEPVTIEVYSTSGQLLYSGSVTTIPVNERGTYLVRVGNYVEKVAQ